MAITQATLDFLLANYLQDSREWFSAHKEDYHRLVVEPMAELVRALTPRMLEIDGGFITEPKIDRTISRIHRDMRIPQNRIRSRYRPNCWILFIRDKKLYHGLPAFYFEIDPAGFSYGMGYYQAAVGTVRTIREMLLAGEASAMRALEAYEGQKVFALRGEEFKRAKYPDQPERLRTWLEKRSFSLDCESKDTDLLFSDRLADRLLEGFVQLAPVYDFFLAAEARQPIEQL